MCNAEYKPAICPQNLQLAYRMIAPAQGFGPDYGLAKAQRSDLGGAHFFLPQRRHGFILKSSLPKGYRLLRR
jgi:hypothetical protein